MTPRRRRWIRRPPPPDPYVVEEHVVVQRRDPRWIFVWLLAIGVFAALLLVLFFATRDDDDGRAAAPVAVPRVLGLDHVRAGARIEDAGLVPDTFPVENPRPAGQVVAQAPPPRETVRAGSTVRLEVSRGPAPTFEVRVPNVTGLAAPEARALLRRAGLTVRTERQETDDPAGQVLRQQPAEGAVAAPFDQVTLVVSR